MAKIVGKGTVAMTVTIEISESEARALDALVGYGDDAFINAFYEKLGKSYMVKHESGLREFFQSIRSLMPSELARADNARIAFTQKKA